MPGRPPRHRQPRLRQRIDRFARRHRRGIVLLLTAFFYLCYSPLFEHPPPKSKGQLNNPNELSRVVTVLAHVEYGTWYINPAMNAMHVSRTDLAGRKRKKADGKMAPAFLYFAGKSPGMAFVVDPFYYIYYTLADAVGHKVDKIELIRFCRLFGSTLPSILFSFIFYLFLCRLSGNRYLVHSVYFVYLLGTMAYPHSLLFVSHQFASGALFTAFIILALRGGSARYRWPAFFACGLLIGLAFSAEYSAAIPGFLLGLYGLIIGSERRRRPGVSGWLYARRHLPLALLGVSLPLALTFVYHDYAFGGPLKTAYGMLLNPAFRKLNATGFHGFVAPTWKAFSGSFLAPSNGLFFFSPFLLLFPLGLFAAFRRRRYRLEVTLALVLIALFALYISCFLSWKAGWTVGPRYLSNIVQPMVVLALLGLDWLYRRSEVTARTLLLSLGLLSILLITPAAVLFPHLPDSLHNPWFELALPLLQRGYFPENLLSLPGEIALTLFGAGLLGVVLFVLLSGTCRWQRRVYSGSLAMILIAGWWFAVPLLKPPDPGLSQISVQMVERLSVTEPLFDDPKPLFQRYQLLRQSRRMRR